MSAARTFVLIMLGLTAGLGRGQYLETTIYLPDSLGSNRELRCLEYDRVNDVFYILNDAGSCLVVRAATGERLTRIPFGATVEDICHVPEVNRLYAADPYSHWVYVIDGGLRRLTDSIRVGHQPVSLCYDSITRRLYCSCTWADSLFVIDVSADTVLRALAMPPGPSTLCLNPVTRKLYCAHTGRSTVSVIDTRTDSIVGYTPVCADPVGLCINTTDNRIYVAPIPDNREQRVAVIDGETDSLRAFIELSSPEISIAWNSADDKLYCTAGRGHLLTVYSGVDERLLATIPVPEAPLALLYCPEENVVCCGAGRYALYVVDGAADTVLMVVPVVPTCDLLCCDSRRGRLLCGSTKTRCAGAVDYRSGQTAYAVYSGMLPYDLCHVPVDDKLYVSNQEALGPLVVIDCAANRAVRLLDVGWSPRGPCYSPTRNRVYCAAGNAHAPDTGVVAVIDAANDSVVARIPVAMMPYDLEYASAHERIYCAHGSRNLTSIDALGDSVLRCLPMAEPIIDMLYVRATGKLYCACWNPMGGPGYVGIVDCRGDSLVAFLCVSDAYSARGLSSSPDGRKVYIGTSYPSGLAVIDGQGDSILRRIPLTYRAERTAYSDKDGKVYAATPTDTLAIVDAVADTVIRYLRFTQQVVDVMWDSAADKVYCRSETTVFVLDGQTDSLICRVSVSRGEAGMVRSSVSGRVYVNGKTWSAISVIADTCAAVQEPTKDVPAVGSRVSLLRAGWPVIGDDEVLLDVGGRRISWSATEKGSSLWLRSGVYFVSSPNSAKTRKVVVLP